MANKTKQLSVAHSLNYALLALISLVYTIAVLFVPLSPGMPDYDLSVTTIHLLQFCIIAPLILVWFGAMYGALNFMDYANKIRKSPDGNALSQVSLGLIVLVYSLSISTLMQSLEPLMERYSLLPVWVITTNYASLIGSLIAFYFIFMGSRSLAKLVENKNRSLQRTLVIGAMIIIGIVYVAAILQHPHRIRSQNPASSAEYFLPNLLIFSTLVVPYIITWTFGVWGAINLRVYYRYSKGIIYKRSLAALAIGLIAIIISSIVLQFTSAIGPAISSLQLYQILLILYSLLIIYAIGHAWVVIGAHRLKKIEETT